MKSRLMGPVEVVLVSSFSSFDKMIKLSNETFEGLFME